MKKTDKGDELLRQFKKWAKSLMSVNPDYVLDAKRLLNYIAGPNWDAPAVEYAHYRQTIEFYGEELLKFFDSLRSDNLGWAITKYTDMLHAAGFEEVHDKMALVYAEEKGIIEYHVNGKFMEYWSFYGSEGWYFVRYDLEQKKETFRGAHIPWDDSMDQPVPAFLRSSGGTSYNYFQG